MGMPIGWRKFNKGKKDPNYGIIMRNPAKKSELAQLRASGMTVTEIAKKMGIARSNAGLLLQRPEIRELVEQYYLKTVSLVPYVYETLRQELTQKVTGEFDREMRMKASDRVAQMSGMLQTRDNSKNVFFQQVIAPMHVELHPLVKQVLGNLTGKNFEGEDTVEGEVLPSEEIVWEEREGER